jgi:hypothetical protein
MSRAMTFSLMMMLYATPVPMKLLISFIGTGEAYSISISEYVITIDIMCSHQGSLSTAITNTINSPPCTKNLGKGS